MYVEANVLNSEIDRCDVFWRGKPEGNSHEISDENKLNLPPAPDWRAPLLSGSFILEKVMPNRDGYRTPV